MAQSWHKIEVYYNRYTGEQPEHTPGTCACTQLESKAGCITSTWEFGFSSRLQSAAPDLLFDFWKHRRTDSKYLCDALDIKHATLKTNALMTLHQCSPVSAVAVLTVIKCFIHHECYISLPLTSHSSASRDFPPPILTCLRCNFFLQATASFQWLTARGRYLTS